MSRRWFFRSGPPFMWLAVVSVGVVALLFIAGDGASRSDPTDCPDPVGAVPEGSECRWNEEHKAWVVVSRAPALRPCDRIDPPVRAVQSSCRVVETVADSDDAMIEYDRSGGGTVRVWVLAGGGYWVLDGSDIDVDR